MATDRATEIHNKGEQDAAKGVYNPPTKGMLSEMVEGYSKQELADIESYKQGHSNTESQKR